MNPQENYSAALPGDAGSNPRLLSLLDGEESVRASSSLRQAHISSFLLHMRPRTQPRAAVSFWHTFHLGFLAFWLFVLEALTGLALMIYYVPTPDQAYGSILSLGSQVPFGQLVRDLHRLGGEAMLAVVFLHLFRTFLSDSFRQRRAFTWLLGVALLLITLGLAFSGYLLPWDQRSYWAVTIGTSIAEAVPLIGEPLSQLLRGGPVIGGVGLLRFYMAHVFFLPLLAVIFMAGHYYRVSRLHGTSLPVHLEQKEPRRAPSPQERGSLRFLPDLISREVVLASLSLLVLMVGAYWFYDAPLESHANPGQTPLDSQAPWFFLWVQGLLKLGDKTWLGVMLPLAVLAGLLVLPYVIGGTRKKLLKRPVSLLACLLVAGGLLVLSYMGAPGYGINLPPAIRILQKLAPMEGPGLIGSVPHSDLKVGLYALDRDLPQDTPPALASFINRFKAELDQAVRAGELAQAEGVMLVEDWQAGLKKVTLRIIWGDKQKPPRHSQERSIYLHQKGRNTP